MNGSLIIENAFSLEKEGHFQLSIILKKGILKSSGYIVIDNVKAFRIADIELHSHTEKNSAMLVVEELDKDIDYVFGEEYSFVRE